MGIKNIKKLPYLQQAVEDGEGSQAARCQRP
jgi:hypothetical protein